MMVREIIIGKANLARGKKWYNQRDKEGKYPESFEKSESIMTDIEAYLNSSKVETKKIVEKVKVKRK